MSDELAFRPMTRAEVESLVEQAADEGWNPGLHDAELFWQTDPDAFLAAELHGEVVGGGAITSYGGAFGFMGLFIVRREYRRQGVGSRLWHARRERMLARLRPGASVGMDGVFGMQAWYARSGFAFSHRDIRFEALGAPATPDPRIVPLADVPLQQVLEYDRHCFPTDREAFLRAWVRQPDGQALAAVDGSRLLGFGVVRRCHQRAKIGPLFADDLAAAEALYVALSGHVTGQPVFLDIPESNPDGLVLAARHDMREVFGCARMYLGRRPQLRDERIFGITTFELG